MIQLDAGETMFCRSGRYRDLVTGDVGYALWLYSP